MTNAPITHPHTLFVYGTLKRAWGNHGLLMRHGSRFLGKGRTINKMTLTSDFPYVWTPPLRQMKAFGAYLGQIVGEVYMVTDEGLADADRLEGHPVHYRRTPIRVELDEPGVALLTAGIYLRQRPLHRHELAMPENGLLEWGIERKRELESLHPQFLRKG